MPGAERVASAETRTLTRSSRQARALDAFSGPGALRTLDALHLASCAYLAEHGHRIMLASYDRRMNVAARAMDIPLFDLEASQSA